MSVFTKEKFNSDEVMDIIVDNVLNGGVRGKVFTDGIEIFTGSEEELLFMEMEETMEVYLRNETEIMWQDNIKPVRLSESVTLKPYGEFAYSKETRDLLDGLHTFKDSYQVWIKGSKDISVYEFEGRYIPKKDLLLPSKIEEVISQTLGCFDLVGNCSTMEKLIKIKQRIGKFLNNKSFESEELKNMPIPMLKVKIGSKINLDKEIMDICLYIAANGQVWLADVDSKSKEVVGPRRCTNNNIFVYRVFNPCHC